MSQHIASLLDMVYMSASGPWHCKWFLQSEYANVHCMERLVQAVEGHHTTQLILGAVVCQLCQMEFQLAVTGKSRSGLYKQLVKAGIFEQLLKVLLGVCSVSLQILCCASVNPIDPLLDMAVLGCAADADCTVCLCAVSQCLQIHQAQHL